MNDTKSDLDFDQHFHDRFNGFEISDVSDDFWATIERKLPSMPLNYLKFSFVLSLIILLITVPSNILVVKEYIYKKSPIVANFKIEKNDVSLDKNKKTSEHSKPSTSVAKKTFEIKQTLADAKISKTHLRAPEKHKSLTFNNKHQSTEKQTPNKSQQIEDGDLSQKKDLVEFSTNAGEDSAQLFNNQALKYLDQPIDSASIYKLKLLEASDYYLKSSTTEGFFFKDTSKFKLKKDSKISYYFNFYTLSSSYIYTPNQSDDLILSKYETPKSFSFKRFGFKTGLGICYTANQNLDLRFGIGYSQLQKTITYQQAHISADSVQVAFKDSNTLIVSPVYNSTKQQEDFTYRFGSVTLGAVYHFNTRYFSYYTSLDAEWNRMLNYTHDQVVSATVSLGIQRNLNAGITYRLGPVFIWNFNETAFSSEKLSAKTYIFGFKAEILFHNSSH